jgi:myosin heavy subunit
MNDLKFSKEQIDMVFRSLAAVLLLGEIIFDPASFDDPQSPTKPGQIKNVKVAEQVAKLLGFKNPDELMKVLLQSCIKMAKDEMWTPNSLKKCNDNRDALAKQIYNNLFNWLVKRMNVTIEPTEISSPSFSDKAKSIGLLDIFGFENFIGRNNFEQLCINYVNEKLHKLYIAAIFEAEKMEMREEGLIERVDQIQYPDLKVLDVIRALDFKQNSGVYAGVKFEPAAGTGIFTTIDDQCMSALNNRIVKWEDVADTLAKDLKTSTVYKKDAKVRFKFTISHSAQSVDYDMKEFVERNIDCISPFLDETMCTKTATMFSLIYQNKLTEAEEIEKGKVYKTIWAKFNIQMIDLMDELAEPLIKIRAPTEVDVPATGKSPV